MRDVYAELEAWCREKLRNRPKARGQGKTLRFVDHTTTVFMKLVRKHGPYAPRIFSACREILEMQTGVPDHCCRTAIAALLDIGALEWLPTERLRKWQSPEYHAYQYRLSETVQAFFPCQILTGSPLPNLDAGSADESSTCGTELANSASGRATRQRVVGQERDSLAPAAGGLAEVPTRTWDRTAPESPFVVPFKPRTPQEQVLAEMVATGEMSAEDALMARKLPNNPHWRGPPPPRHRTAFDRAEAAVRDWVARRKGV